MSVAAHPRLRRLLLPALLIALLAWIWATDQPSPVDPNGRFPGIVLALAVVWGLGAVLSFLWRAARGH